MVFLFYPCLLILFEKSFSTFHPYWMSTWEKNKKNAIVKYIVADFSDVCCSKSPNRRLAINSINLVPNRASRFPPLLQWHRHPHSQTHVSWASPSHITLAILVRVGVRVTGDAHITRVFGMGMPKTRGCSYHYDTVILENDKTLGTILQFKG